ncbi:MAG: YebC/PmpR family DNA-binding transcriptional regulator [bacterium]|nr:YebC/PmpR family DNA-binding transcriptional regulator [bacterium]
MGRAFEYRRAAKERRWDKMSKLFPAGEVHHRGRQERRDGSGDERALRTAILNAKAQNMPRDNIEAAISAPPVRDAADIIGINYEGKGPHGVLVFVECATDNTQRTVANIRSYFNKVGGQLLPNGSLEFAFDRKVAEFAKPEGMALEELELALIDGGLQELAENEGTVYVYGDYSDFGSLAQAIEAQNIEVTKAGLQRIPQNPQEFSEAELADIEKLLDRIEDDEDTQAVYTNIA